MARCRGFISMVAAVTSLAVVHVASATIHYVNATASAGGDGVTWATAYTDVQSALGVAVVGDEVWVAEGVYRPEDNTSFVVLPGVSIYGGFAGTELNLDDRVIAAHPTTFEGAGPRTITVTGTAPAASTPLTIIDGLIVHGDGTQAPPPPAGSNRYISGGGLSLYQANVLLSRCTVRLCRFRVDQARFGTVDGVGLLAGSSVLHIEDCLFEDNLTPFGHFAGCAAGSTYIGPGNGAALYADSSSIAVTDSNFTNNRCGSGGIGACSSRNSQAGANGGAIASVFGSLAVSRCVFERNIAGNGASSTNTSSGAGGLGGAIFFRGSGTNAMTIDRTVFVGNTAGAGGNDNNQTGVSPSGDGGAVAGIRFGSTSPAVFSGCIFIANQTGNGGNSVGPNLGGSPGLGSAISLNSATTISNCVFAGNSIGRFGNNHFIPSNPPTRGLLDASLATIRNSIFLNNTGSATTPLLAQLGVYQSIEHSCVAIPQGPTTNGNINLDPRFLDLDGPDDILGTADDDYRLAPDSPCIDAGRNDAYPATATLVDLLGNPRFIDDPATPDTGLGTSPIIDIGAVEFVPIAAPCPADQDDGSGTGTRDSAITIDDLLYFLGVFQSGNAAADLDDGSATGTHDGAVTIDDLLFFLDHFNAGC
ncbi:MAG: hypothetical protein IPK69_04760 [Phycisphaerales bacterium]|nr:MAG: hypothetical protein IPK69_04760 [Phycisphaerales bacterium]